MDPLAEFIAGGVLIATLVWGWDRLGQSKAGRWAQAAIVSAIYLLWMSLAPIIIYFAGKAMLSQTAEGRFGSAVFIAVISLTMAPVILCMAIPWNNYCHFMWKKCGLRFPQSQRLAEYRDYHDWERQ